MVKDDELLKICIDALRGFDNELGHSYIKIHPEILSEVKRKIANYGMPSKEYYNLFWKDFLNFDLIMDILQDF